MMTFTLQAQITYIKKLGTVMESSSFQIIEQNGKLSYSSGQSIFSSSDEGLTWDEILTPLDFTSGHTRYIGLKNGNYVLITGNKLHYRINGQWNLLLIDGDSHFTTRPVVIDDKVILFKENDMYVYDDNTKEVKLTYQFDPYTRRWVEVFQNHFIVQVADYERQIWTKDLQYVSTIDAYESVFITKEGMIIRKHVTPQGRGKFGNRFEISKDNGQSFSLFHNSDEELRFVGEIDGRLYFRGYLTQLNAWLPGKNKSRLGYFDMQTGEITEIKDGNSFPVIANNTLYHRIGGTYIKYPDGDLNDRIILSSLSITATPIEKLRRASDGVMYALTRTFLYRSYDEGESWENLLGFHGVEDIDLDDDDNLYCLSEGRILKSQDEGMVFTELPQQYSRGTIEYPNEIICIGSNKLIVKGIGDYTPGGAADVGCWDCYDSFPQFIFMSDDEGATWEPIFVSASDYPYITAANQYGYPSDQAINSSYYIKTNDDVIFTAKEFHNFSPLYNYGLTTIGRTDLSVKRTKQLTDESYDIRYGLTINGDLIKNDKGKVFVSKDCGINYHELSLTSAGDIFPGAAEESIYVISDNDHSEGAITYQDGYGNPFVELDFKLMNTNKSVPNLFDKVYTDGVSDFLFSDSNTYEVVDLSSNIEETALTGQEIIIFPNPVSEILNINIQRSFSTFKKVEVYDAKARLISTLQIIEPQFELHLESYVSGIYLIRIISENKIYNQKVIKL